MDFFSLSYLPVVFGVDQQAMEQGCASIDQGGDGFWLNLFPETGV